MKWAMSIVNTVSTCKRDDGDIFLEKANLSWTFVCLDSRREDSGEGRTHVREWYVQN